MFRVSAFVFLFCILIAAQQTAAPKTAPTVLPGKPIETTSGLKFFDLKIGTGKKAIPGFTIKVLYTGWIKNGKAYDEFDSTRDKGPYEFDLGRSRVIQGWDEGIAGMHVGGKRQLIVPPSLAYGGQRVGNIPPNSTLIFEVELLGVR